jgi:predicted AAA+ superfamily ATPase
MPIKKEKTKKRAGQKRIKTSKKSASLRRRSVKTLMPDEAWLKHFGMNPQEFDATASFMRLAPKERVKEARTVIQDSIIEHRADPDGRFILAVEESESLLRGYATLDDQHRGEIQKLMTEIAAYLQDSSRKRPFNALMLAAPGAGKSHFIKQLAGAMKENRVQAVTLNMATIQSPDDMAQPIDELRNLKVNDRFPLLFLDEFDSDPSRYPALLPLLWDGELQIGHRDLKLGKAVIVLAGSNPDLPKAMDQSAQMRLEVDPSESSIAKGKLIDLLSRISGGIISIPDLDLRTEHRDRRVDKVCVAVALLKSRFGNELEAIPRSLLRFIAETKFRYGVRSIAHLIDLIGTDAFRNGNLKQTSLALPFANQAALQQSSLKLHLLDKDQGFGIVNRWNEFSKDRLTVSLREKHLRFLYIDKLASVRRPLA